MFVLLIMEMNFNMKKYLLKIFMMMVCIILVIVFLFKLLVDKEDTLDALIRNVKDQQRESQVVTTSVFIC